jgi:drug/metabolite transporter (DMT)-like permease
MMTERTRAYIYIHFCVLIWGFTAILGKLISLSALPLVWWRVVICCATLWWVMPRAQLRAVPRVWVYRLLGIGALIGLHWVCFYGAIKLANASVAVAAIATTSFFSAFTGPWLLKTRLQAYELVLGIVVLAGMFFISGYIDWSMRTGFGVGVLAALLAAIFSTLNKKAVEAALPPFAISFFGLSGACLTLTLLLPAFFYYLPDAPFWPQDNDWWWLLLLAWVCTLVPYYFTLRSLEQLSPFSTNLALNLEPVYGILLAVWLFREDRSLSPYFYVGMALILAAVFSYPLLRKTAR